jgi:uncharacterized protein YegL
LTEYERAAATGQQENLRPVNVIVITDGVATDDLESMVVFLGKELDRIHAPPSQVGIQFFQVGDDRGASEALRELDDDLAKRHDVRDFIDTVTWDSKSGSLSSELILKTVLGAVHRKLDNRKQAGRR